MLEKVEKTIAWSFYLLFFFVPLVFYPQSFELFEFNKMVLTYAFTVIILALWLIKCVLSKKVIFKRTFLDVPLLVFLGSQILSTLTSIDFRTSLLGYYSRFHGGLTSSATYAILYWAFVSNMDKEKAVKSIYSLLISATLVSVYAVLQHFGIDKDIWVQDVQNRVFSTLGQPNWLAAWITALMPITWAFALKTGNKKQETRNRECHPELACPQSLCSSTGRRVSGSAFKSLLWILLSGLFFLVLLYTKSRSGLLGFGVSLVIFWGYLIREKKNDFFKKPVFSKFLIHNSLFLILILASGTPWTPSLNEIFSRHPLSTIHLPADAMHQALQAGQPPTTAPALEIGGTASEEIRKIVWQGATDIWKNYPILGSGVETFAFAYYKFRPTAHNMVTEWDFLYNKAHNEYLNFLATTGAVGFITYSILILAVIFQISNIKFLISNQTPNSKSQKLDQLEQLEIRLIRNFKIALLSGFLSILVTNFFGFSVVPVALLFFLYPAIAITIAEQSADNKAQRKNNLNNTQKALISLVLCSLFFVLFAISKYYCADLLYSKGKMYNNSGSYIKAKENLEKAVKLSSREAIFLNELSQANAGVALTLSEQSESDRAIQFAKLAFNQSQKAVEMSTANVNLKRDRASTFIKLSAIDSGFLVYARNSLENAVEQAPTDAKLYYNLALSYLRTGDSQKAIETLNHTIGLKNNYRNAYYARGLIYIDEGGVEKAKENFQYILENLNPNDKEAQRELNEIENISN